MLNGVVCICIGMLIVSLIRGVVSISNFETYSLLTARISNVMGETSKSKLPKNNIYTVPLFMTLWIFPRPILSFFF